MNTYQVFNPITGTHTRCYSDDEAKAMLIEVAKQVLALHVPSVNLEIVHENGDVTWMPFKFPSDFVVTI